MEGATPILPGQPGDESTISQASISSQTSADFPLHSPSLFVHQASAEDLEEASDAKLEPPSHATGAQTSLVVSTDELAGAIGSHNSSAADDRGLHVRESAVEDMQNTMAATGGALPESWQNETLAGSSNYNRGSFVAATVAANEGGHFTPAQQQQGRLMEQVRSDRVGSHLVSSQMVADAIVVGANPFAVSQLGVGLIKNFRIKSLALIVMQVITVLFIGVVLDMGVTDDKHPGTYFVGGLCAFLIIVLFIMAGVRHVYPLNYFGMLLFTLVAGCCLGLSSKPMVRAQEICCPNYEKAQKPGIYAFGFYAVGLCILAVLAIASAPGGKRVLKVLPCAFVAMLCVNVLFFVTHSVNQFMPRNWLILADIVVSLCILWVGFECDRLAQKLKVDEYLLPVILVWADLLVLLAVTLAVIVIIGCSCMAGEGCGDGMMFGMYGCNCHSYGPWIGDNTERRQDETAADEITAAAEAGTAPQPQTMGQ